MGKREIRIKLLALTFGSMALLFAGARHSELMAIEVTPPVLEVQGYLPLILRQATPTATSTPTATPTPSPTPTQPPGTTGDVKVIDIYYDGAGSQEPDEYVAIRNDDAQSIQLQGWTLRDEAEHVFTFPAHVMAPGQICRVYTNENHPGWCGFSYGSGSAIWNNGGDCAYLRDGQGTAVDLYCY